MKQPLAFSALCTCLARAVAYIETDLALDALHIILGRTYGCHTIARRRRTWQTFVWRRSIVVKTVLTPDASVAVSGILLRAVLDFRAVDTCIGVADSFAVAL